jgi:hypothetical protein
MSGTMDELSRQLQRRIASGIEISGREALSTEAAMGQFLARHRLTERALSGWLTALRRDPSWLAETLRSEVAFDRLVSGATTDDARRRKLASMQLSLVKIDIETLELDSAAAAREAVLCVRDDGARLSEVARDAGYRSERAEVWMDALEDSVHQAILGAAEGEVIGPIECDAHFKVCQVLRKVAPSISDPAVSDRIDDVIIHEFFDDLCARHTHAPDVARTRK